METMGEGSSSWKQWVRGVWKQWGRGVDHGNSGVSESVRCASLSSLMQVDCCQLIDAS